MNIVGIDPSLTRAGVAVISNQNQQMDGQQIHPIVKPILLRCCGRDGRKNEPYQMRSRRVRKQVRDILDLALAAGVPDLAVIEAPIYGGTFLPSYFDRAGLFHGIYGALDARNIPVAVIPPTTGHQFTTGKGRPAKDGAESKRIILEAVRELMPDAKIANHDIAEALGYALMGAMAVGLALPFRARRWQLEAVHVSTWPTIDGRPGQLADNG